MSSAAVLKSSNVLARMRELPEPLQPQAAPGTWECALQQLPSTGRILNAGAGRGGLSWLLGRAGYSVVSVDLHPEHFVAENLECSFADLTMPLPFEDASFDAVLAVEVVEHLENPWQFLREAIRVLRPGGTIVFTSPNVISLFSRWHFLWTGVLPYFREESFVGCYHVTPVFPWSVVRWSQTSAARLKSLTYNRVDWPTRMDVPRFYAGGWRRRIKDLLPLNRLTGEIVCFEVEKIGQPTLEVGLHYR